MKSLIIKIRNWPIQTTLFSLLLFYIPFQDRYHKLLKIISKKIFHLDIPSYIASSFSFYITDIFMLLIIIQGFRKIKTSKLFYQNSLNSGFFLMLFGGIVFLSIFTCAHANIWTYYHFLQLFLPLTTCIVLSKTLEIENNSLLFFGILCVSSCIEGIIVIKQYLLQHSIGLRGLGELTQHFLISPSILMGDQGQWIFDKFFHTSNSSGTILRPAGTFPHPNVLGGFMGIVLFATFFLFTQTKKKKFQWLLFIVICFQTFILYLTFSRSALFGVLIGTALFLGSFFYFIPLRKKLVFLTCIIIFSHSLPWIILYTQLQNRGGIISQTNLNRSSDAQRIYFQKTAISMFKKKPFLGHGWGEYGVQMEKYSLENQPMQVVHNIYLLVLSETGIFGFIMFMGFIFTILYQIKNIQIDPLLITLYTIFIFILFCGLMDHYWLMHQHGRILFFLIASLISAYVNEKKVQLKQQIPSY